MFRIDQSLIPKSWLKGKEEQIGLENGTEKGHQIAGLTT